MVLNNLVVKTQDLIFGRPGSNPKHAYLTILSGYFAAILTDGK